MDYDAPYSVWSVGLQTSAEEGGVKQFKIKEKHTVIASMLLQVSVVVIRVAVVVPFSLSFFVTVSVWAETAVTVAVTGLVKREGHAFFFFFLREVTKVWK